VAKKLSATALSQQSLFRLMLCRAPRAPAGCEIFDSHIGYGDQDDHIICVMQPWSSGAEAGLTPRPMIAWLCLTT
jgi:hypothetical protein